MRRLCLLPVLANLLVLASCGGSSKSTSTTVGNGGNGQVTLLSIAITPNRATIAQGTTQAFTATGNYSDGSAKDLTATAEWSCLLPNLATVSSAAPTQGLATALPNVSGPVVITAAAGGMSNGAQLNITNATATSLAVTPATATIGFENQLQYTAIATFSDNSTQDVTAMTAWGGPPPFITASGLAIGNGLGTFSIFPSFNGQQPKTSPTLTVDLSNLVSVGLDPGNAILPDHAQLKYSAVGTFNDGSTRDVSSLVSSWTADNYSIATDFGSDPSIFKGAAVGSATIGACVGTLAPCQFNPSTALTISSATLQSIAVLPANATLAPTTKVTYSAIGTFSDGTTQDLSSVVSWSEQDGTGAATINGKGVLTATSAGTVTVDANSPFALGSVSGQAAVTITAATLQSIAVTPASAFTVPGASLLFSATGTFNDGTTQDVSKLVTWTSSNSSPSATTTDVATVAGGLVTAQGVGQTGITAVIGAIGGAAGSLKVVSPSHLSLAISPSAPPAIAAGTSTQLAVTGTFADGTTQDFTTFVNWSSSNANVATVGYQSGLVAGLSSGQSTITAMVGTVSSSVQVTVQ